MDTNDRKGPGDASKKKRAPTARKRAPKGAQAAEQNRTVVDEREVGVGQPPKAQDQADGSERVAREAGISTPRAADQADPGNDGGANPDANRAADLAADLKSWMDARRGDREEPREVL
jgi:hypothetical protein